MKCTRNAAAILIALLVMGFEVRAATQCAAGNPNTTSLPETTPATAFSTDFGVAVHSLTGLMWKRCPEGMVADGFPPSCSGSAITLDWQGALQAANLDTTAGYADWRLPNAKELLSIVEYCGYSPSINQVIFPGTPSLQFWSSSTVIADPFLAVTVDFGSGESSPANTKAGTYQRVRLVRGGDSVTASDLRGSACNADFDGNGTIDALTDGVLFIRAALGLTGTAVTAGAVAPGAPRNTWATIRTYMNANCGTNFGL